MTQKEFSYGIIPVLRQDGRDLFLLVRHKAGHWSFPKGHAEPGETEVQTARRELSEETGITACDLVNDAVFAETYPIPKRSIEKTVKYFLGFVKTAAVRIQPEEIIEYAWSTYEDALKHISFPEAQKILRSAHAFLHPTQN